MTNMYGAQNKHKEDISNDYNIFKECYYDTRNLTNNLQQLIISFLIATLSSLFFSISFEILGNRLSEKFYFLLLLIIFVLFAYLFMLLRSSFSFVINKRDDFYRKMKNAEIKLKKLDQSHFSIPF